MQAFYLVSRFHDHLESAPIGFTSASGNFEKAGGDAVQTQTSDGATIAATSPDAAHRNNANMTTPPDGLAPKMQMYLFRDTNSPTALDWRSVNGGDDSGLVWHEYTHGLSNRLVTNADGSGALSSAHSGAMGEGWSDWYASDLQVREGLKTDAAGTPGEIDIGDYTDADLHRLRSQALDCPVNTADPLCPGGVDTAAGGYTLGDFGKIFEGPEVHADGELWAETLWDLRQAVGSDVAEQLVTNGMRLSPPEPSMLDMRNSILAAEQANGGGLHDEVWEVFRVRGMGYRAAVSDGNDTEPVEDFTLPPDPAGPKGTTTGVVTDSDSGLPLAGVRVGFGGHASRAGLRRLPRGRDGLAAAATRSRTCPWAATRSSRSSRRPATTRVVLRDVSVAAGATTTHNLRMTRDWAALGGGAVLGAISDNTGEEFGCGADKAFDQSQATVWSSFNPDGPGTPPQFDGPPTVVLELPQEVDVTSFLIDPKAGCGNDETSSTREYTIETSANGTDFQTAVDGRGAAGVHRRATSAS